MIVISLHLPFLWQLNPVLVLAKWLLGTWGLCAVIWKTTTTNTCRLIAERWVRQVHLNEHDRLEWVSFSFMLDGCLYFRISAYAALKMKFGIRWYNESYTSLCHTNCNVTNYQLWRSRREIRSPTGPINRFGKKDSSHFNNEIEKLTHWFNFWTSEILSVRPNDDNHYTFSIFT